MAKSGFKIASQCPSKHINGITKLSETSKKYWEVFCFVEREANKLNFELFSPLPVCPCSFSRVLLSHILQSSLVYDCDIALIFTKQANEREEKLLLRA